MQVSVYIYATSSGGFNMRMIRELMAVAGMLAMAGGASAQIDNFQSRTDATLKIDGVNQILANPVVSPFYVSGRGGAGAGYSSTAVDSGGSIFFQAGTMAAGAGNSATSLVEISLDVTNNGAVPIDQIVSTIFESNFGLYVANFKNAPAAHVQTPPQKLACTGANLANCTPIKSGPGFGGFRSVEDSTAPFTLAFTSFAFEVLQDNKVIGGLAGSIQLDRLSNGSLAFIQGPGFGDLDAKLNNFSLFGTQPNRVYAFSWDDTYFFADLDPILPGQKSTLTYRITTESWSDVSFKGAFDNLIVAFSCFADPLGRGSLSSVFTIPGFGPSTCNDYRSGSPDRPSPYSLKLPVIDEYGRIVFTADGTAPIPEPDTWAMLILGFGLVGFSMRRRKKLEITAS